MGSMDYILGLNRDHYLQVLFILLTIASSSILYFSLRGRFKLIAPKFGKFSLILTNKAVFLFIWLAFIGASLPIYLFLVKTSTFIIYFSLTILVTSALICIVNTLFKPLVALIFKISAWIFCALIVTGLFSPLVNYLNNTELNLGLLKTSYLKLIESIGLVGILTWAALSISTKVETQLNKNKHINKSTKLLLSKLFRMLLLTLSIFLGMSLVGIDLSVITFLSGALGVAVGFGMQNIYPYILWSDPSFRSFN